MSYPPPLHHGETGEVSAHVVRAGIEPAVVYPNGNKVFYLAHVPAGGIHGFRNEDGAAKMLLHFAPGAPREAYFEQLAAGIADFDEDAHDRFMREHDNTWV